MGSLHHFIFNSSLRFLVKRWRLFSRHFQQIARRHLASSELLNLQRLLQTHPPGPLNPVIHLPLTDRRIEQLAEGRLGQPVLVDVVAELH